MGFGIGLGPRIFRVRVSTRGVGLSSGIGPFSIYGRTGGRRRRSSARRNTGAAVPVDSSPVYLPGDTTTTQLAGASAHQLAPTGSDELVAQLNRAQHWLVGGLWGGLICLVLCFATPWFLIPTVPVCGIAFVGFSRRRVLLHYEVDSDLTRWFEALATGWPVLAATNGKWRVQSSTRLHRTHHRKMNAGAGNLVSRDGVAFQTKTPLALKTDIKVLTVKAKRHSLIFLPDRVLVKSGSRWSDIDYNYLNVTVAQTRFIENSLGSVPRDGTKVGETWQYANVNGGPDRRFKNNRRLSVMLYSEVAFTSPSGLSWELQLSRHDVAIWWQEALRVRPLTPLLTSPLPVEEVRVAPASATDAGETPAGRDREFTQAPDPAHLTAPAVVNTTTAAPRLASRDACDYSPPRPAGQALAPWGRPWNALEVAGESYHQEDFAALFVDVPDYEKPGGAEIQETAVMVPDPDNPHGEGHAVAVFVRGRHVGYVPHEESVEYFPRVLAMTAGGSAVTVDARVWASSNYYGTGFRARVTLSVPQPDDFNYPESMPDGENVVLLPLGYALQATGEEQYLDVLLPYLGQNVAVTLHNVTVEKGRKQLDVVEVRLTGKTVGRFTPATSAKVGPLVAHIERLGRLPVARASVAGNSLRADVTVYVARAGDVPQDWLDGL